MAWEVGKVYRTRKGEEARFLGMLDTTAQFQTHVFAVKALAIPANESIRMCNADGRYGTLDKSYRPYDVISDEPTPTEKAAIDRVMNTPEEDRTKVLLEILREIA
jgi:thioesterase domain-containing protein